jgi:hypothetical protein
MPSSAIGSVMVSMIRSIIENILRSVLQSILRDYLRATSMHNWEHRISRLGVSLSIIGNLQSDRVGEYNPEQLAVYFRANLSVCNTEYLTGCFWVCYTQHDVQYIQRSV